MDHDHIISMQNSDPGYLAGNADQFHHNILPPDFSIRSENPASPPSDDENDIVLDNQNLTIAFESERQTEEFNAIVERCRAAIKTMNVTDEKSEYAARQYLADIGIIVHSNNFDIDEFAQNFDHQRATQANRRNPYLFVIKCLGGAGDIQRASNQSLALTYAVRKCLEENREISTCFKNLSIRECLKLYRMERQKDHKEEAVSSTTKVKIEGVPNRLLGRGKVAVEIEFNTKGGRFICELDL
ncbi:hypothetical protein GCM10010909_16260 [Acidocella aquatica]|uniref:DRBM domain-containing protein n=2 Tax=Acidocella aquatica TaxID=1922313 RepID=A0ABQ6A7W2_9PROT|nr:hypothetical protein GCM10010909_16260 [Acidocella aquatica]